MNSSSLHTAIVVILLVASVVLFSVGIFSNNLFNINYKNTEVKVGLTQACTNGRCESYFDDRDVSKPFVNLSIVGLTFSIACILALTCAIIGCLTKFKFSNKIANVSKLLGLYFMIIVIMICLVMSSRLSKNGINVINEIGYGLILVFVATSLLAGMKLYWAIMN